MEAHGPGRRNAGPGSRLPAIAVARAPEGGGREASQQQRDPWQPREDLGMNVGIVERMRAEHREDMQKLLLNSR